MIDVLWPKTKNGARLMNVATDQVAGVLFITAVFDEEVEQDIGYEEMYYSQLNEGTIGFVISSVEEITPYELGLPKYTQAATLLYADCCADEDFIHDMYNRGNRLFVHHTKERGEFIVLAKRLFFDESRPYKASDE